MFKKLFGGFRKGGAEAPAPLSFEQRRKTARRRCEIEVTASHGRKSFPLRVVDMSVGGLRLQSGTPLDLKEKTVLKITYPEPIPKHETLTTECVVRWSKTREADGNEFLGVEFKDGKTLGRSWVKAKMHDLGFQSYNLVDQRKNFRVECQIAATIDVGGNTVYCSLKDIGLGGFCVHLRQPLRAGATIELKVGAGSELAGTTYKATLRHEQQADPGDPFGYGCVFVGLSSAQDEALRDFLIKQTAIVWEKLSGSADLNYERFEGDNEDIEIPDLASILADEDHDEESGKDEA